MCKVIAIIIWVVGVAIGFALLMVGEGFIGLISLASALMTGTLFWVVGQIVEELGQVNENLHRIGNALERNRDTGITDVIVEQNEVPEHSMTASINGEWICKKCQTKNKTSDMICKVCGKYR